MPLIGIPVVVAATAAIVGAPGLVGLGVSALRTTDAPKRDAPT